MDKQVRERVAGKRETVSESIVDRAMEGGTMSEIRKGGTMSETQKPGQVTKITSANLDRTVHYFKLPRTGDVPIGFYGELVASRSGKQLWGREQYSWYEISVYRTISSKFVISIAYRVSEGGYQNHDDVLVAEDPTDVIKRLREYETVGAYREVFSQIADDLGMVEMID